MIDCHLIRGSLADAAAGSVASLSAREHDRAQRFRRPEDRARFVAGRILVRTLVGQLIGVDPAEVDVRTTCRHCGSTDHGQPLAAHPRGCRPVSISHAGDCIVAATCADAPIGVDVELVDPNRVDRELIDHIRAPDDELGDLTGVDAFYRLWTAKEAALKCTGHGLLADMRGAAVDLRGTGPTRSTWRDEGGPAVWITPLELLDGYVGSLAVAADQPPRPVWVSGRPQTSS